MQVLLAAMLATTPGDEPVIGIGMPAAPAGFVGLDFDAITTKRRCVIVFHGFPYTVGHERRGSVCDIERAMELIGAHVLLGSGYQMESQHPFMQRNVGTFKECSHGDGKLLAACIAHNLALLASLAAEPFDILCFTAAGTVRTIGPAQAFKMLAGLCFVMEDGIGNAHLSI